MDTAIAVVAAATVAVIAFRRIRGMALPSSQLAKRRRRGRSLLLAALMVVRLAVAAAALAYIVLLTRHLFD